MASFSGHIRGAAITTVVALTAAAAVMHYSGHLAAYLTVDHWPKLAILVGAGLVFGLFPDIDIHSRSQRILYFIMLVADLILIWERDYRSAALLGLFGLIPPLGKHRGWTHTWKAAILVPAAFFIGFPILSRQPIEPYFIAGFGVSAASYICHLVMDGYIGKTTKQAARLVKGKR